MNDDSGAPTPPTRPERAPLRAPVRPPIPSRSGPGRSGGADTDGGREAPRWAGLTILVGCGLVGVIAGQVVIALIEGLSLKSGQPSGIPNSLYHRIGIPFGGLGGGVVLYLLVGLTLSAVPTILAVPLTHAQRRLARAVTWAALGLSMVISVGSVLAVVSNLHDYASRDQGAPSYVRLQLATFLLGVLGTSAVTIGAALSLPGLRREADEET